MRNVHIAIIDSGIDCSHDVLRGMNIVPISIKPFINDTSDNIGHGTAVASIIIKSITDCTLYSLKIFDNNYDTSEDDLINALTYINNNLDVDIINVSSGVTILNNEKKLYKICSKLCKKNVCIVSAMDNLGVISYPAAFDTVIGVYWDAMCSGVRKYTYVTNSVINILGYGGIQRLPWINNSYKYVSGSSFSAPYITAIIAGAYQNRKMKVNEIFDYLENHANHILSFFYDVKKDIQRESRSKVKHIKKAIVFPINKEVHAILGNADLLNFQIAGAYDVPQLGKVGTIISDLVYGQHCTDGVIQSYASIDWSSDFDTVILGHTQLLNKAMTYDFTKYFINKCLENNKNIYCFDNLSNYSSLLEQFDEENNFAIWFHLCDDEIQITTLGSLFEIGRPVLGVFGTSPKQGKFNLQLELRRRFLNEGLTVGQLGTEPTSWLFGIDITLPTGYGSCFSLTAEKEVYYINKELSALKNNEIIIVGAQSQTIPYSTGNIGFMTFSQHNLLLASHPDAIILCINANDEVTYISRTISYLREYFECEVIAICLYPFNKDMDWNVQSGNQFLLFEEELEARRTFFENNFHLPTYVNGYPADSEKLFQLCIKKFS